MDLQSMADELNLECVFFFFICGPRKDLALKREPQQKILNRFLPVVGVRRYGICDGAGIRDAAFLRERLQALFPVQAEIIVIEPEKDAVSLLMPEQRDRFIERLQTFDGDTAQLAAAILAGDGAEPYCGEIKPYRGEIQYIYGRLRGLLAEYAETDCYHKALEGASDPDGLAYALRRLGEIREDAAPLAHCPAAAERMKRILDETEVFLRRYEQPGVVMRWRERNPLIEFFDCAFDLLEEEPELFEQIRTDRDSVLQLKCCPASEDLPRRRDYFAVARQRFAREGRPYSGDAAFQDELCRTLNLVFRADFGELWSGVTAGG